MGRLKTFCTYAGIQILGYTVLVYNFRVIADKRIVEAMVSDALYAALTFFFLRKFMKEADNYVALVGYVAGSVIGTAIGMKVGK